MSIKDHDSTRLLLIGAISLITCLAFESLATTNTMPTVIKDLGGDRWYSLAVGITLTGQIISTIFAGWITDTKGIKFPLIGGITLFALGALIVTFSPNLAVFTVGRAAQGLGAGLSYVPIYVLVGQIVPVERRAYFFAAFSYAWMLPGMVGPALAGLIIHHWHWRPVFGLIIPLTILSLIPLLPIIKQSSSPSSTTSQSPKHQKDSETIQPTTTPDSTTPRPPLLAVALTGIAILIWQVVGGLEDIRPKALGVGIGLCLLLVGLPKLLPDGTLRAHPGVPAIVAMRILVMGAVIGAEFFIPLVLSRVHQWPANQTGWVLALGAFTWSAGSWFQAKIINPRLRNRLPIWGTFMLVIGMIVSSTIQVSNLPVSLALSGWTVSVFGLGMAVSTSSDLGLLFTPQRNHGQVSAALQLADSLGPALMLGVTSVCLTTWQSWLPNLFPFAPAFMIAVVACLVALTAISRNYNLNVKDT